MNRVPGGDATMKKDVDQILDEAADLFVTGQKKWIQGHASDDNGGACMAHAIWLAAKGPKISIDPIVDRIETSDFVRARTFVIKNLVTELPDLACSAGPIPDWNDDPVRTEDEVVDKLRSLAKEYREKAQGEATDD